MSKEVPVTVAYVEMRRDLPWLPRILPNCQVVLNSTTQPHVLDMSACTLLASSREDA